MNYSDFKTFKTKVNEGRLDVTFDNPPVNIQDIPMLDDLDKLAQLLEQDSSIKVVVFDSANPEIFVAHADVTFLKDMSTQPIDKDKVQLSKLQNVLNRISKLPQATIAKIAGYCRGGGNEFAMACDMRFADKNKAVFMQMEVGMGILPCGGGSSRLAKIVGLGNALEMILSAKDYDAEDAERIGLVNRCFKHRELDKFVDNLADRIAKFPAESITACKTTVHKSLDTSTEKSLYEEEYQLYQATSQTPAIKRFKQAYDTNFQNDMKNQENFEKLLMTLQDIK